MRGIDQNENEPFFEAPNLANMDPLGDEEEMDIDVPPREGQQQDEEREGGGEVVMNGEGGDAQQQARRGRPAIHVRRTLNQVVYNHLKHRILQATLISGQPEPQYTQEMVTDELTRLVTLHLPPTQQDNAIERIGHMLNRESVINFGLTLSFLHTFHQAKLGIWIVGFLGESVAVGSCTPGAMERIATGLRGINDDELDRIFAQAEGPQLFRIFLGTFNIFHESAEVKQKNLSNLIEILVARNVTEMTSPEQVKEVLMNYMSEMKANYSLERNELNNECEGIVDILIDNYESDIQPELVKKLNVAKAVNDTSACNQSPENGSLSCHSSKSGPEKTS